MRKSVEVKNMTKETKQVKQILKHMQEYALKNGCEFSKIYMQEMIHYNLYDYGLILSFNVSFDKQIVYIEEFSENSDIKQEMSFKEFIKFQEHFLERVFDLTDLKKHFGYIKHICVKDLIYVVFDCKICDDDYIYFLQEVCDAFDGYGIMNFERCDAEITVISTEYYKLKDDDYKEFVTELILKKFN